jgi:uncharacterized membrane protein YsdA (DUF1294 family)
MLYVIIINILTFLIYAYDKHCARKAKWRISEKVLLSFTWLGGSLGAYLAMCLLHHKTRHKKFQILVPVILTLHIILLLIITE